MAQIISEELGVNWKNARVQLASNDPQFNDPVLGAQIAGGGWSSMKPDRERASAMTKLLLRQTAVPRHYPSDRS